MSEFLKDLRDELLNQGVPQALLDYIDGRIAEEVENRLASHLADLEEAS